MPVQVLEYRGATTPMWTFRSPDEARSYFSQLKNAGATSAIIDLHLRTQSLTDSTVAWEDAEELPNLKSAMKIAAEVGLDVWIKPIVVIGNGALNWADLEPADKAHWFADYQARILDALSADTGRHASHLLATNELATLTTNPANEPYWTALFAAVRNAYDVKIGFNSTGLLGLPAGQSEFERIPDSVYKLVDFIGISAYPRITGTTLAAYEEGWQRDANGNNLIAILQNFFARNNKDIYFTELGSPANIGGNVDYRSNTPLPLDPEGQRLFFEAAQRVIAEELSGRVKGMFAYAWSLTGKERDVDGHLFLVNHQSTKSEIVDWFTNGTVIDTTKVGTDHRETMYGTNLADIFKPGFGSDVIFGYEGNDRVEIVSGKAPAIAHIVSVTLTSDILDGIAAEIAVRVNGVEQTVWHVRPVAAGINSSFGNLPYSTAQEFSFTIPSDTDLATLEFVHRNDDYQGFGRDRNAYISSIAVDGNMVAKDDVTYHPQGGAAQPNAWNLTAGGFISISASKLQHIVKDEAGQNKIIDGGAGLDIVAYQDSRKAHEIRIASDHSVTVTGTAGDQQALHNVERLQFSDGYLGLDLFGNTGQAYRIYQAAFNRAPDTAGLSFWIKTMDRGMSLHGVASGFVSSAEFDAVYGRSLSNRGFIDKLYENVLGRAGDNSGISFWVGQLEGGAFRASVLAGFSESLENIAGVAPAIANGIWYV